MAIKTLEFKIRPNQATVATIEGWFADLRRVWNEGLNLLMEARQWYWREKSGATEADWFPEDAAPVEWQWHCDKEREEFSLCCSIIAPFSRRYSEAEQYRPACTIKRSPSNEPPPFIPKGRNPYMSLCGWFSQKNQPWLSHIPSWVVRGTLKSLAVSWQEAMKSRDRGLPKFKSRRHPIKTIACFDCSGPIRIDGNRCQFGKLGWLTAKGLDERWTAPKVQTAKICKRASGWYLQLTGDIDAKPLPASDRACGLDVGVQYLFADDAGNVVEPPRYLRQSQQRLTRLQRKLSKARKKSPRGSKRQDKLKQQIARLHERIKYQRSRFNHKISTYKVRTYGAIAVEDIKLQNLYRRAKPIERKDGSGFAHNNATAKSGLTKSMVDGALGQAVAFIEAKAKAGDRKFVRVPAAYTSQDCPACGHREKKSLSQRTHRCSECGYTAQRDVAAAQNIRARACSDSGSISEIETV